MDLHLNRVIHLNKVTDLQLNSLDLPLHNEVMDLLSSNQVTSLPNINPVMDLCQVNSSFLEDHPLNNKVMDLHPLSSKAMHPLWVSK